MVGHRADDVARDVELAAGMSPMREPRATLQESWKVTMRWSLASLSKLEARRRWIRSQVTSQMCEGCLYRVELLLQLIAKGSLAPAPMPVRVFQKL
jgi:hypothetical protein